MQAIQVSGQALLALINDILDFSRMESRKLTVERAPFPLREVVEESLEIIGSDGRPEGAGAPLLDRRGHAGDR